jgi:apolipoprotein N-acyltransferase
MKKLFFAAGSAFLLCLFWPGVWGTEAHPFVIMWLFALVPMLWVEHQIRIEAQGKKALRTFGYAWLSMGLFNLGTTYWVWNAHWSGVVATVLINGALMATVWTFYGWVAQNHSQRLGYWAFVSGWLALEVFHENWAFSFPWLDLGHIFAASPGAVQWYEWTGHRGGTLWLLAANLVLFEEIRKHQGPIVWKKWKDIFRTPIPYVWGLPLLLSQFLFLGGSGTDTDRRIYATYVQPNMDPYTEKFRSSDQWQAHLWAEAILRDFGNIPMAKNPRMQRIPSSLVVFPETFLHEGIQERYGNAFKPIHILDTVLKAYPHTSLLLGASTYELYEAGEETSSSRPVDALKRHYYDSFNSAIELTSRQPMEFYHKSKLVVGVEYMPFGEVLRSWIGDATIALGGTTGSLGTQKEREVFTLADTTIKVAPIICWEQDYGVFVRQYAQKGANLFAIMTNDGWWGNSLGHVTHFHIARLRAIENRRYIIRSANTGISGFIDPTGQSHTMKTWGETGLASAPVFLRNQKTFYTQYGDLIGRGGALLFPLLLLSVAVRKRVQR